MHSAERYGLQVALTLCFASSEDESYPAEALRSQTKLSCGWQSAKHCGYPQELGFRFNGQVSLEFVRILAHESKISSLIDIYVANATNEEIQTGICAAYETAEFVRLGHVRFSPNEESNCQARELKTVGVHRPCMYLKLILRNPHHSTYNMFQQVGLVGITAHGQLMHNFSTWAKSGVAIAVGEFMDTPLDEMTPFRTGVATSMIVMDKDNNPVVTDAATSRRLSELNRLKARAVAEEDYDLANAIKQQISAATTALNQILELEQEKLKAVENEDFAKAKDLKRQIDALRNSGYQRSTAILAAPPHGGYSSGGVSSMPPVDEQSATAKGVKDEKTGGIVITEKEDPNARQLSPTENAEPWERKLNEILVMNCAGQEPPVALEGEIAAEGNLYEKDLGIYCVGCLFSRRGRLREAAIRSVVSDEGMRILSVHTDSALASMVTYMASQGHGITDPAAAAVLTTCEAMERIISDELSGSTAIVQGSASFAQLVSQLVARVGDSNNRIREAVEKAVVAVARSVFGTDRIVAELIGDAKKMIKRSVCFHLSRFHILTTFVNDFGIDPSENDNALEVETLLTQVVLPCLEHSTKSVREAAAKLFAKLMILNTDICQPLLSGLKPTLQALIQQQAEELRKKEPTVSGPEMDVDTFSVRDFNSELTTPMHRGRKAKRSTPSSQRRPSLQSGGRTPRQTPRRPKLPEKLLHDEGSERSSRITPRGARKSSLVSLRSPYRPGTESARSSPSRRPPPVAPLDPQIGKDEYEDFQSGAFAGPPPSDHGRDTTPPPTGRSPRRGMISPEEKTTEEFEDEVRELAEMLRQTPRHPHSRQSRRSHSDSSHTPKAESATSGGESSRRQRANSIPIGTCQFCGVTDPNFNEETLDVHFVRFCPMLCPCPLCDQVTEISTLQQHLVSECEGRGLVRECPRCHEAIRAEEIKRHVAANTCIATADDSEMCPLCHACFKSGLSEWRKHLAASPGCPNNPRKWDGSGPLMIM